MSPKLVIFLCLLQIGWLISVSGSYLQPIMHFMNGKWREDTFGCTNESNVMEINAVLQNCVIQDRWKPLSVSQHDALRSLCQGRQHCNVSDQETTMALQLGCDVDLFILIHARCESASSLFRMCSGDTRGDIYPISLYGPLISTFPSGKTCTCSINTRESIELHIVALSMWGEIELNITEPAKNQTWSHTATENFYFNGATYVEITLSAESLSSVDRFYLEIDGYGTFNATCFNATYADSISTTTQNVRSTMAAAEGNRFGATSESPVSSNTVIIATTVVISLFGTVAITVAVFICKRKYIRSKDKHPEITPTYENVLNGIANDVSLFTNNSTDNENIIEPLQNQCHHDANGCHQSKKKDRHGVNQIYENTEPNIEIDDAHSDILDKVKTQKEAPGMNGHERSSLGHNFSTDSSSNPKPTVELPSSVKPSIRNYENTVMNGQDSSLRPNSCTASSLNPTPTGEIELTVQPFVGDYEIAVMTGHFSGALSLNPISTEDLKQGEKPSIKDYECLKRQNETHNDAAARAEYENVPKSAGQYEKLHFQ